MGPTLQLNALVVPAVTSFVTPVIMREPAADGVGSGG
jgi:hypothetical protein